MNQFASASALFHGSVDSLIGGRSENQDNFGYVETPLGFLVVVCDGMGGGPGGKTASYVAVSRFMQAVREANAMSSAEETLKRAVALTQEALAAEMHRNSALRGMGSTLVAVLFTPQAAWVVHAGDSRCYRMSDGKMRFRTADHSLVGELVQHGTITEEQARKSPQSNIITQGLGSLSNNTPTIDEVPYKRGDRFFLCTDGVWGMMPQPNLLHRFASSQDTASLVTRLQTEVDELGAAHGGGHDNHTLAIVQVESDSKLKDKMDRISKIIIAVLAVCLLVSLAFNIFGGGKFSGNDNAQLKDLQRENAQLTKENEELNRKKEKLEQRIEKLEQGEEASPRNDLLERVIIDTNDKDIDPNDKESSPEDENQPKKDSLNNKDIPGDLVLKILNEIKSDLDSMAGMWRSNLKKAEERHLYWVERVKTNIDSLNTVTEGQYQKYLSEFNMTLGNIKPALDAKKHRYSNIASKDKIDHLKKCIQKIESDYKERKIK